MYQIIWTDTQDDQIHTVEVSSIKSVEVVRGTLERQPGRFRHVTVRNLRQNRRFRNEIILNIADF